MNDQEWHEAVQRYRELFFPKITTVNAYKQERYQVGERNSWCYLRRSPTDHEWRRHLDWSDDFWLGWPCLRNSFDACATEYLVFDIDAKRLEDAEKAIETVNQLLNVFGDPWFICRTPSHGFHVYHRLDRPCELTRLVTTEKTGVVADSLRAAGINVGREHKVEIYPQVRRCLRGPLGTRQPLVDPDFLTDLSLSGITEAISYVGGRRSL